MDPEQMQAFFNQMQRQRKQDSAAMQALITQLISSRSNDTFDGPKVDLQPERTMDTLASSITEFVYDPELNLTFETWYARYEDLFLVDANKLDEAAKVRLLLRKLSTSVHSKYVDYILPKHSREFDFACTVDKLKQLFGNRKSQFSMRYNCLQMAKSSHMDFSTYAAEVNKQCENFKLSSITLDQFKCLIFVMGLKAESDFDIRTRMLTKLDTEANTINLDALSRECQRIINLKLDTALVEKKNYESQVNKLLANEQKLKKPKTPCWFCGAMHYVRDCTYKNHSCEKCHKMGHKEGYCKTKSKTTAKQSTYNKGHKGHNNGKTNIQHLRTNSIYPR